MVSTNTYMLIFRDAPHEVYDAMSFEEREACMDRWNAWFDSIAAEGKLQAGHPLEPSGCVVTGAQGERVLDGPFAEAKEFVGGYFLITAESLDEATAIARRCPNLTHGMTVEVRPVSTACELAKSLGRQTMRA